MIKVSITRFVFFFQNEFLTFRSTTLLPYDLNKDKQFFSICTTFGVHLLHYLSSGQFVLMCCFCEWFKWKKKCSLAFLLKQQNAHSHVHTSLLWETWIESLSQSILSTLYCRQSLSLMTAQKPPCFSWANLWVMFEVSGSFTFWKDLPRCP